MSNNESAAITAMQTALTSIQHIRNLLAKESDSLSEEAYAEIDNYLAFIEDGLSREVASYGSYQYTPAPHLYEDDESDRANFWQSLAARVNRNQ